MRDWLLLLRQVMGQTKIPWRSALWLCLAWSVMATYALAREHQPRFEAHVPTAVLQAREFAGMLRRSVSGDAGTSMPAPEPAGVVVLNKASVQELVKLPGVGPKRAEAILQLRARLGRFARVEDLLRVRGIGRKTLARLRPLLRVDE